MRDIFVITVITGLLPACFRRPYVGLLVFSWLAYMRVPDLSWGTVRNMRWSYYVCILTFFGFLVSPDRKRWFLPDIRCWIMMLMVVLVGVSVAVSESGTRAEDAFAMTRVLEFTKIVVIALFTTAVVTTRAHLRVLLWVIALSFAFYGVKSGLAGILTLGRTVIKTGPGGMLADNNDFSLALAMAVPLLFHLGMSEKKPLFRKVFLVSVPLTVITVGLTHSRGGFLSVAGCIGVLVWRSRNRVGGIVIGILIALMAVLLAPSSYKERLSTLRNVEQDSSANARFRSWAAGARMAVANPWLGVGLSRFRQVYLDYQPNPNPQELSGKNIYVAHNSYVQIWAECGSLTLLCYFSLLFLTFVSCWKIRRMAKRRYYASWMINYATAFEASLVAFMIGSTFLNRAHFDLFYHFVAIVAVFEKLAKDELKAGAPVESYAGADHRSGEFYRLQPAGFGQRPRMRGFRDTPLIGRGA